MHIPTKSYYVLVVKNNIEDYAVNLGSQGSVSLIYHEQKKGTKYLLDTFIQFLWNVFRFDD
jgi:hypothetical protein